MTKLIHQSEWRKSLVFMIKENCIEDFGDNLIMGPNKKLQTLLYNLILQYVAAVNLTCNTILKVIKFIHILFSFCF